MRKEEIERLRDAGWSRALTPDEEAEVVRYLEEHSDQRPDWEVETAVQQAFRALPRVTASTNFTAQVLEQVDREEEAVGRSSLRRLGLRELFPWRLVRPMVYACLVVLLGWGGYASYLHHQRMQRAESLATIAEVERLPSVDALRHFEVIRRLDEASTPVDEELLVALE